MALQINPWDDTYEKTLSYEEKIEAKRRHLALIKVGKIVPKNKSAFGLKPATNNPSL